MRLIALFLLVLNCLWPLASVQAASPVDTPNATFSITASLEVSGDQAQIYLNRPGVPKTLLVSESARLLDFRYAPNISISPDGQQLIYVAATDPTQQEVIVWRINTDGTNKQTLAHWPARLLWATPFVWSSNGTQLAYVQVGEEGLSLWSMSSNGYGPRLILNQNNSFRPDIFYGDPGQVISWSSDNRFIVYTDRTATPNQQNFVDPATGTTTSVSIPSRLTSDKAHLNVPLFSQNDPRWQKIRLHGCPNTLGSQGCAVSAAAMVFKYYGIDTDPQRLNDCLGSLACPLDWNHTSDSPCTEGKVRDGQIQSFDFGPMEAALAKGYPVIVGFRVNSWNSHFVVVTGGKGGDPANYWVNDPWDGSSTKKLKQFFDALGRPDQLNIFVGTPPGTFTPAQGSSRLPQMMAAYNRNGGLTTMSNPVNPAHWWYGAVIQDFAGDPAALLDDEEGENRAGLTPGACNAFVMRRGLFGWYAAHGNPETFGLPTSDEYVVNGVGWQSFARGFIQFGATPGFTPWPTTGNGWRKEFYNNAVTGCGPGWVEYEPNLTFEAGKLPAAVGLGNWSAVYTRQQAFEQTGVYAIRLDAAVGAAKLWLDDTLVLDGKTQAEWVGQVAAGSHRLRLELHAVPEQPGSQPGLKVNQLSTSSSQYKYETVPGRQRLYQSVD